MFIDEGVSGARLDRPALDRLRDLAAEGVFEALLVTTPDRLARRYAYQVLLVEEFHRCGCDVVFVQNGLGASPEEQMLLQMQGVFAEYERALIQERTRRGRLYAARQGRVNWGNPPYGYTYVRKTLTTPQHLVINEAEAEVVRLIDRWCVQEQMSSYAIHQRLDRSVELRLLEGVEAFCASVRDAMASPSFEVKQKVLQLVLQRIVVEDHRPIIEHIVPSGPIRLQPERQIGESERSEIGRSGEA